MPATYEPIATTTLSSAASTITFSSIPNTYTDLRVVLVATNDTSTYGTNWTFNSDTANNYSWTVLEGDGTTASSNRNSSQPYIQVLRMSNLQPNLQTLDIMSYAGSTNKSILITSARDLNGSGIIFNYVGLWRNTAAITSIRAQSNAANFATGTTATLYGIKAA